ncbi:MAG: hypothetical protein IPG72_00170 [Ardenticatenales bacterium]|nr:hypothetical protein [Ardenticatenales bacterium]
MSRSLYRPLLESGVRIFEWQGTMIHAKTAVADGLWSRVGSTNLNLNGWVGNWELDVAIEDKGRGRHDGRALPRGPHALDGDLCRASLRAAAPGGLAGAAALAPAVGAADGTDRHAVRNGDRRRRPGSPGARDDGSQADRRHGPRAPDGRRRIVLGTAARRVAAGGYRGVGGHRVPGRRRDAVAPAAAADEGHVGRFGLMRRRRSPCRPLTTPAAPPASTAP